MFSFLEPKNESNVLFPSQWFVCVSFLNDQCFLSSNIENKVEKVLKRKLTIKQLNK